MNGILRLAWRAPARPSGAAGAIAGLFLARVALEATARPWPAATVIAVGLLAALGGFGLSRWRAARGLLSWPLLLLLAYVLWPRRDPTVAVAVALLAVLLHLMTGPARARRNLPLLLDGALFLAALLAYALTANPDILPADAGEFQLVAARLGVAHPPGYPLYTMLGHLVIRLLPWGTPAGRLNLLSALLAAATLLLLAQATRRWAGRLGASPPVALAGGLAAALALGTSTTFWAQATIANIRTPTLFFATLALWALSRFATAASPRQADRALLLFSLALGLGLTHHASLAFVALFFVAYVLLCDPRLALQPRRWWKPALAALVGLLPLAYLPIRAAMGAPLAPEGLTTLAGFFEHVRASGFAGDMFAFANATDLPHRLALLPTLFPFQFNDLILIGAAGGLLGLLRRDWRLFVLLTGSLLLHTFVAITYRAPQTVEYLMPAYLPIAIAFGLLPAAVSRRASYALRFPAFALRPLIPPALCGLALWAALLNGWSHAPSFAALAGDQSTRQAMEPLLESAPSGALILADWHWATPLWYLQQVEGLRPDVEVRYVYPLPDVEYREVWRQWAEKAVTERPVLLTHFYEFDGFTTEPWGAGFRVRQRPVTGALAPLNGLSVPFGRQIRLLGYRLPEGTLYPGQVAEVVLAWQPAERLERAPSFTLRLMDAAGNLVAQSDRTLSSDALPGEVRFERLFLPLRFDLLPGRYRLRLGAYVASDAGFEPLLPDGGEEMLFIAPVELTARPAARAPVTLHPLSVPFSGGPALRGVDYDRSQAESLRVILQWRGPAEEGLVVHVYVANGAQASAPLPALPAGTVQAVTVDLPGGSGGALRLALTDAQDRARPAAGPWGWPLWEVRLPAPSADARFVPLGDEMAVIGARTHRVGEGQLAVDVALVALQPLVSDDAVSVRLTDADGRWLSVHDGQPGLGAVPTLKWIAGSRVVDRHLLDLPAGFAGGDVRAALVAYERFRLTPLLSLDGRFESVPLGAWLLPGSTEGESREP